ncbi:MAG: PAS domain-containing protein, partial [Candidatus Obscuribacterales bacterium]|nr:PAS domain-containing protein [Candidatus Obscuribacterales bacterium]
RAIIFGRHDLIQDAPISKLDLLVCRNTLMYLNSETQRKILSRLHFALNNQGYLFLGNAELMLTNGDLFRPLNLKHRIFSKVGWSAARIYSRTFDQQVPQGKNDSNSILTLRDAAFEEGLNAQLLLNLDGTVSLANGAARSTFGIDNNKIGSLFQDLELSYRPVELRSVIDECYKTRKTVVLESIEYKNLEGHIQSMDVIVCPLIKESKLLGVSISFADVSKAAQLKNDLLSSNRKLESVNKELQSTREELETSNEELQSTNEELETTNEELQSTNEELETMNEELQSTNEELETMNSELREISLELNLVNKLLSSVFSSLECAVIALNSKSEILLWNDTAFELWGLRAEEVKNKSIYSLDFGLDVSLLKSSIDSFLASKDHNAEISTKSTSRRGKEFQCQIKLTKLIDNKNGLVMLIHPQEVK